MSTRGKLTSKIRAKESEIQELETRLREARAYLQALQDAVRLFPREGSPNGDDQELRTGSEIAKARDLIRRAGRPLHISEIVAGLGKDNSKKNRVALAGSLARYVRNGTVFTRPAPNTFGLTETRESGVGVVPPDDFGTK